MTNSIDLAKALLNACSAGDAIRVAELLNHGASANSIAESAETHPLFMKVWERQHLPAGEDALISGEIESEQQRVPPPAGPFSFEIPIFCAIEGGSLECVRLLLAAGADVNQINYTYETPLMVARDNAIIQLLLTAGADFDARNTLDRDALQLCLGATLEHTDFDPFRDMTQKLPAIQSLLAAGAQLNCLLKNDWSRLYDAAWSYNVEAVKLLLDLGADVTLGNPPLSAACWNWNEEYNPAIEQVIDLLVAAGADVHVRDEMGDGLLHAAVMPYSHSVDEGRDWCSSSDGGNYTAMCALLKHGADPNLVGWHGRTPLMVAISASAVECVQALLAAGADPSIPNEDGYTAIDYAAVRVRKRREAVTEQQKAMSDPQAASNELSISTPQEMLAICEEILVRSLQCQELVKNAATLRAGAGQPR